MKKIIIIYLCLFSYLFCFGKTKNVTPIEKNGKQIITQDMFKSESTRYVIKYDCYLSEDIIIPLNSELVFRGGRLSGNNKLIGNHTRIKAKNKNIFGGQLAIVGVWDVKEVYPQWFGAIADDNIDDTEALTAMFNFPCSQKVIPPGNYNVKEIMSDGINNSVIIGRGATLHYTRYNLDSLKGEKYGQVLCNYTIESKPSIISHDLGDITIYGLTIDGHKEQFIYDSVATKITALINHHAIRFICGGKIQLYNCEFRNTFMTAVLCEACDELIVDSCRVLHSGECEKYKPYGYFYTWEGVGLDDRCYLQNITQTISCKRCIVKNSYFEDIAGSYASANCSVFESYNNRIKNNRGYFHEISGHINHGNRIVNIHDNIVEGLGSSLCMLNNFNIEDDTENVIRFENNKIIGYKSAGSCTLPTVTQLWYENFVFGPNSSGKCKTIISHNQVECSTVEQSGNFTFNANNCTIEDNVILNYSNSESNNQLFYLPRNTIESVTINNNVITGNNAYLVLLNYCKKDLVIKNNKLEFISQPNALSSVIRGNWKDVSSRCKVTIENNKVKGLQYIYSAGVDYAGHLDIINNNTDAKIGLYYNNPIRSVVDCSYQNNILSDDKSKVTNAIFGLKTIK